MNDFSLSYVICTKNRLPFLKILFDRFFSHKLNDEEIIVVDGDSGDGTKEYLQQLFDEGKIHRFISEPDHNQAHGWNKALLMARGTIIKKIIDDDVHSYAAIQKCKDFMLKNPQVDICISNCLTTDLASPQNIHTACRLNYFEKWKSGKTSCFTFSDVYMLIRKDSLSYLGLFDTQFTMMDWEYSLRCSYLKATIVFYTGYNALAVGTPGNVTSSVNAEKLKTEGLIGKVKYGYAGDRSDISFYSEFKIAIGKALNYKPAKYNMQENSSQIPALEELDAIYNNLYLVIEQYNNHNNFVFIY